jgi:hypothetical protein
MLSHLDGSAASYLVEGSGAHASPPRFLQAPLLWDGLFVAPDAGGLCPLAWLDGAGCIRSIPSAWATAFDGIRADCSWAVAAVRSPM